MSEVKSLSGLPLSEEEREFYEKSREMSKKQLTEIDAAIEAELAEVREKISKLQDKRRISLQMHDAACNMLGVQNEFAEGQEAEAHEEPTPEAKTEAKTEAEDESTGADSDDS